MTGRPISLVDAVLPERERLRLARRDALGDFRGAVGSAIQELMSKEVTPRTWRRYAELHAKATARYRNAIAPQRAAWLEGLADVVKVAPHGKPRDE